MMIGRRGVSRAKRFKWVAVAALSFGCFSGAASAGVTISQFPPNPGVLPGGGFEFSSNTNFGNPPPQRAWVNGVYGSVPGVRVTDPVKVQGPAGDLNLSVAKTATVTAVAVAAARALKVLPYVNAGVLIWDAYNATRVRPDGTGQGISLDPGQDPVMSSVHSYTFYFQNGDHTSTQKTFIGESATCAAYAQSVGNYYHANSGLSSSGAVKSCTPYGGGVWVTTTVTQVLNPPCGSTCVQSFDVGPTSLSYVGTQALTCPAWVDALNPAYSGAAGAAPDADGKCPTGRYSQPVTPEAAAQRLVQYKPPSDVSALGKAAVANGQAIDASPSGVTGPATQQGQSTTTTTQNPDGTSVVTTKTPTYNYTYGPSTVNYNTTTVTVTNNNGSVTTTTSDQQGDPTNPCTLNPGTLGCQTPDSPPDEQLSTARSVPISYQPVDFASAGCPADIGFTAFSHQYTLAFTPLCDAASTWVRGVVLVVGAALAAFVFVGGLKM